MSLRLSINDKKDIYGYKEWAIEGSIPWILDDFEDKMQTVLGIDPLTSINIYRLDCKSVVANEFLDALCCYDMLEYGLDKLRLL